MSDAGRQVRDAVVRVIGRIAPEADVAALEPDANLRRELDLDSVDFQNFLIGLARELGRDIPDRMAPTLTTLAACVKQLAPGPSVAPDASRDGGSRSG